MDDCVRVVDTECDEAGLVSQIVLDESVDNMGSDIALACDRTMRQNILWGGELPGSQGRRTSLAFPFRAAQGGKVCDQLVPGRQALCEFDLNLLVQAFLPRHRRPEVEVRHAQEAHIAFGR